MSASTQNTTARKELLKKIGELARVIESDWVKEKDKIRYRKRMDEYFKELSTLQ